MSATPTAREVMEIILRTARVQIAASAEAQAIIAAGLGHQLDELVYSTAANAAQIIRCEFDDTDAA